jgi:hypothetical protein
MIPSKLMQNFRQKSIRACRHAKVSLPRNPPKAMVPSVIRNPKGIRTLHHYIIRTLQKFRSQKTSLSANQWYLTRKYALVEESHRGNHPPSRTTFKVSKQVKKLTLKNNFKTRKSTLGWTSQLKIKLTTTDKALNHSRPCKSSLRVK